MVKTLVFFAVILWIRTDCFGISYADLRRLKFEAGFDRNEPVHLYTKNYDNSRLYFLAIIDTSETEGYWDICLQALTDLAYISSRNFSYQTMKEAAEKGHRIIREKSALLDSLDPQYSIRAEMLTMIGSCYLKYNDTEKASVIFEALVKKLDNIPDPHKESVFIVYSYIAESYMNLGLYEKVYTYYLLAEKSIPDGPDRNYYASFSDQYLGTYFYRIKNYNQAKWHLTKALKTIRREEFTSDWKPLLISNYDLLALIYENLNRHDSAMIFLKKSLALQNIHDPGIVDTYENYGDCLWRYTDFTGAIPYYQRILEVLERGTYINTFKIAQIHSKIADCYQKLGNNRESLKVVQHAFAVLYRDSSFLFHTDKNPELASIQPDKILIRLLIIKSNALFQLSDRAKDNQGLLMSSLSTFHLTTLVIDEFRQKISTDDFKEFFVTDIRQMYENAVMACYSAYETSPSDTLIDMALYFMEKSKNQVLLDAIKANYAKKSGKIPESVVDLENQFKNTGVELQNTLYRLKFNNAEPGLIQQCQYEYAKNHSEYSAFLREIEKNHPAYYNLKYKNKVPTIDEIRRKIKNSLLIEYMVGGHDIAMIALSDKISVFKVIRNTPQLRNHIKELLQDVSGKNKPKDRLDLNAFNRFVHNAGNLYSILLKPAIDEFKGKDRLIIIPDGMLCFLPFEVLIKNIPSNWQVADYKKLNYILKENTIRYEFSSELLFEYSEQKNKSKSGTMYLGFAPSYDQKKGLRKVNILGSGTAAFLTPLRFSTQEIEEAASIFKGRAYFGANASANSFKEKIHSSKIVHFAGHTIINDSIPELSGIFFSDVPGENGMTKENGEEVIYVNEIFNLNMDAELVILSACETGTGKLLRGEGLMSIGRAFKYAGCPNLIMSLWKINDRSASEIINRFNRNLKKGQNKDVALRNAKIDYINSTEMHGRAHPFFWSAFIMIGEIKPLFHKSRIAFIPAVLVFITVFLLFWLRYRRTH